MRLLNQIKKRSPVVKPQFLLPGSKGLATLPTIIILSLVIIAIGVSMMISGFIESLMSKATIDTQKSFYLSDSGIDDALLKIARDKDLGKDSDENWGLPTSGTDSSAITVSGGATTRVIGSVGIISEKQKNLETGVTLNEYGKITATTWEEMTRIWYDPSWPYRKTITFTSDSAKIPSTQTDFPILINLSSDADLAADAQADGDDILFTTSNGTTKLDHEIEKYSSSTGSLQAWVKVPSLSTNTIIYMYYGNATCGNQQNAVGVWDTNFMGVWHLKEEVTDEATTTSVHLDSTANDKDANQVKNDDVTAKIYIGQDFDGTDDYIIRALDGTTLTQTTVSFWVNPDANLTTQRGIFQWAASLSAGTPFILVARQTDSTNARFYVDDGYRLNYAIANDAWHYVAVTLDTSNLWTFYVAGASQGTYQDDATHGSQSNAANVYLGNGYNGYMDCMIDEVHISNSARSADWIKTSFENQNDPSTFYSVGAEETP